MMKKLLCALLFLAASISAFAASFEETKAAAERGNTVSQFNLAVMYARKRDDVEAVKWYRKAAEQGHAEAQCNLGIMYLNGDGVKKDNVEAEKWLRKAAEQGDVTANALLDAFFE